jgi:hypothetical protein
MDERTEWNNEERKKEKTMNGGRLSVPQTWQDTVKKTKNQKKKGHFDKCLTAPSRATPSGPTQKHNKNHAHTKKNWFGIQHFTRKVVQLPGIVGLAHIY